MSVFPEIFKKEDWDVRLCSMADAKHLVKENHYSGRAGCMSTHKHGLYFKQFNQLVGAAIWMPAMLTPAKSVNAEQYDHVLNLSRFVILDCVPKNAASFLLSKSMKIIESEKKYFTLLTYADEWQNHLGTMYKASNWFKVGMTKPHPKWVDKDGNQVTSRPGRSSIPKSEMISRGWKMIGKHRKVKYVKHLKGSVHFVKPKRIKPKNKAEEQSKLTNAKVAQTVEH